MMFEFLSVGGNVVIHANFNLVATATAIAILLAAIRRHR